MHKKTLSLFLAFFLQIVLGNCQNFLKGKVLSERTREPISFTHIYSLDFPEITTITNEDGTFVWSIPTGVEKVSISHINYKKMTLAISDVKRSGIIYLADNEFVLSEVTVGSLTPHSLMEKVIDRMEENHKVEPVYYEFYMRYLEYRNTDQPKFLKEYVGIIFQKKNHNSAFYLHKSRLFAFDKNGNADKIRTTTLNEVMTDNIFKYKEDVFIKRKLKDFTLEYLDDEVINDRRNYVIRYFKKDTTSYHDNGYLFIDKESLGIARMVMGSLNSDSFKDIYFQLLENKWYLHFVRYPRSIYNSDNFSERVTMYSVKNEVTNNLEFLSASALVRPFVSEFVSDFNDAFWEGKNYIPLPDWITEKLK